MNKSIKYILEQLTNDEESRNNLEISTGLNPKLTDSCYNDFKSGTLVFWDGVEFPGLKSETQEKIIRRALSRTKYGKAVLSALEGTWSEAMGKIPKHKTEVLYHTFDKRLYFGDSLDSALAVLDEKMEELKLI